MSELSKKRWVSPICDVLIYLFATPKKNFLCMVPIFNETDIY